MSRPRSPESIKAEKRYRAGEKLVDIARALQVPEGTVRRWKSIQKWDDVEIERSETNANVYVNRTDESERSESEKPLAAIVSIAEARAERDKGGNPKTNTPHRQARPGNNNAAGNKGGAGGPPGNKKAVTTGEYERIDFSTLRDEAEIALYNEQVDKQAEARRLIGAGRVRLYRMGKRIAFAVDEEDSETFLLKSEEALTRVSAEHRQTILALHRMEIEDAKRDDGDALERIRKNMCEWDDKLNTPAPNREMPEDD